MAPPDARRRVVLSPAAPSVRAADEMREPEGDLARTTPLGDYLRFCHLEMLPVFEEADQKALANQSRHRALARRAAVAGTLAILLALAQSAADGRLAEPIPLVLLVLEGVAVLGAAFFVAAGLLAYRQEEWLLWRTKAERLRLAKFRFLIDPETWTGARWDGLRAEIEEIGKLAHSDLARLASREEVPVLPAMEACSAVSPTALEEVLTYYQTRRLASQLAYFERAASRDSRRFFSNPRLLPLVFFASVLGVLLHVVFQTASLTLERSALGLLAACFITFSAVLPAIWTGIRTYRSANEFARNTARSAARRSALLELSRRLAGAHSPFAAFQALTVCEFVLAADQQEWLRLMLEAEWYG